MDCYLPKTIQFNRKYKQPFVSLAHQRLVHFEFILMTRPLYAPWCNFFIPTQQPMQRNDLYLFNAFFLFSFFSVLVAISRTNKC